MSKRELIAIIHIIIFSSAFSLLAYFTVISEEYKEIVDRVHYLLSKD